MMAWLIALLVLGVLVLVHEFGHFVVARWCGVRVVRFSIGFGPTLLRWRRGETEYALCLLPLGGYVKMAGEQHTTQTRAPGEFLSQPAGIRARIIIAGPFVNVLTSLVTLWTVLIIGYPELLPTVGRLVEGMPAQVAGLQVGDTILEVDGKPVRMWDELTAIVHRSSNRPLQITVDRSGTHVTLQVTPEARPIKDLFGRDRSVGLMGISPSGAFATYRLPPIEALGKTFVKHVEWTGHIGLALWLLVTGRLSAKESLTGPIGIIYMTSEAVQLGLGSVLYLMSILSLSLAIFNLFPIPVLDGGHLLFLALEKIRRRPVSLRIQEKATQVSMAVLVTFIVLICVNDLYRFGLVDRVLEWWRPD